MTSRTVKRVLLTVLVLVFVLPVAVSWYLVFFTDFAREAGGIQHGDLITPPRPLRDLPLLGTGADGDATATLYGKWSLLFFVDGSCGTVCAENLYRVRQIRLATGRHRGRVQRVAVVSRASAMITDWFGEHFPGQLYAVGNAEFLSGFEGLGVEGDELFLIDPRGFLMMRYAGDTEPSGIIRDLSRLLGASS